MTLTNNCVTYLNYFIASFPIQYVLVALFCVYLWNHILKWKCIASKELKGNFKGIFKVKKMCFFPEKYIREFPGSNGLLRPENKSYRKSHWSLSVAVEEGLAWKCRLAHILQILWFEFVSPRSWNLFPTSLCRKKGCLRLGSHGSPLHPHRALPQAWVCLWPAGWGGCIRCSHWGARGQSTHVIRLWSFQINLVLPHFISSISTGSSMRHHKISWEELMIDYSSKV